MRVTVDNLNDGEVLPCPVVLLRGSTKGRPQEEEEQEATPVDVTVVGNHGSRDSQATRPNEEGRFKCLLHLWAGRNQIFLRHGDSAETRLTVRSCPERSPERSFQLVYIVCGDSDGRFQGPEEERGVGSDVDSASRRLSVAGLLVQCFFAEGLACHGLGRRTIALEMREDELGRLSPTCKVLRSRLREEEAGRMSGHQLWEHHAREIIEAFGADHKFVAVMAATRYANARRTKPKSHSEVLSLTRAHCALGAAGLALLGSGCLYTWAESLSDVQKRLLDVTPVDSTRFMDDSNNRQTLGGCYATTLGALIHEVGHCLDLQHAGEGIMARGFHDMDRFFAHPASRRDCAANSAITVSSATCDGGIRGKELLERYQRRKSHIEIKETCGQAFWTRSNALTLFHHRWLRPADSTSLLLPLKLIASDDGSCLISDSPIVTVELRYQNTVIKDFQPEMDCRRIERDKILEGTGVGEVVEIFAMNTSGELLRWNIT